MFQPPRCPNSRCEAHAAPVPGFYHRCGHFRAACRPHPIPRFRCKRCRRTFSWRTFQADYHDKKPHLNADVLARLTSGVGYRETARDLGMSLNGLYKKVRKIEEHTRLLHHNLMGSFGPGARFSLDELESFEECRSLWPVTFAIAIEMESMFHVDGKVGRIPPSGRMTPERRARIAEDRRRNGARPNESKQAVAGVLATLGSRTLGLDEIRFVTDEKRTYPGLLAREFGEARLVHTRIPSKRRRDTINPMFRINLTNALARDRMSRLRRKSWLVSKRRRFLEAHFGMWTVIRNYHRPRFNGEDCTPAMVCGFLPQRLTKREILRWRQDWGPDRSIHPLARFGESVAEWRPAAAG